MIPKGTDLNDWIEIFTRIDGQKIRAIAAKEIALLIGSNTLSPVAMDKATGAMAEAYAAVQDKKRNKARKAVQRVADIFLDAGVTPDWDRRDAQHRKDAQRRVNRARAS